MGRSQALKKMGALVRRPTERIIVAAAALFVLICWGGVVWQLASDRATVVRSAVRDNRSRAIAFEQYVRRTLEEADLAASYLEERYGGAVSDAATGPTRIALPRYFAPVIVGAQIADRDGRIRFATNGRHPKDVRGLRIFRELRAAPGIARAITRPYLLPGSNEAVLLIARSMRDAQGRFAGAVAVMIPTHRFVDFNADARFRPDDLISVISLEGITLARREGDVVSWGQDLRGRLVMQHQLAEPNGEYWGNSATDGRPRLFSHQRLSAYGIFVTSGIGENDVLAPVRWRAGVLAGLAAAFTLAVCALLALYFRRLQEQRRMQGRFDVMRDEFAHSARIASMNEMAAGLAHELNQPLAAASNFLAAGEMSIKGDAQPEAIADLLHQARGQIARAGEIIRRIRDYLANGSAELRAEAIDATIDDAIELAGGAKLAPQAHIVYAGARPPLWGLIDRVQIQQVLVNLIRNAAQAMAEAPPERRTIRISSESAPGEFIRISVADTGPGFAESVLHRFKMPFNSTKGVDGMGIGLSICRRIIEAHGGELEARNDAGGAVVWFTVPQAGDVPDA